MRAQRCGAARRGLALPTARTRRPALLGPHLASVLPQVRARGGRGGAPALDQDVPAARVLHV